jgi:hypothetical protein
VSSFKKAARELQAAVKDLGLEIIPGRNGCDVYRGEKHVAGYNMTNGEHSVTGAIRDLRKRGLIPADEEVVTEKTRRTQPADARKARARKKVPAPITRLPRDVERVPAERVRVEDGVRFGMDCPTAPDPRTGVRAPVGQKFHRGTATGTALLAAASGLPAGVAVVADADDTLLAVQDHRTDLAAEAVAAQSDSLGDADRPVVPVRAVHDSPQLLVAGVPVVRRIRRPADLPLAGRESLWQAIQATRHHGQPIWLAEDRRTVVFG